MHSFFYKWWHMFIVTIIVVGKSQFTVGITRNTYIYDTFFVIYNLLYLQYSFVGIHFLDYTYGELTFTYVYNCHYKHAPSFVKYGCMRHTFTYDFLLSLYACAIMHDAYVRFKFFVLLNMVTLIFFKHSYFYKKINIIKLV